MVFFASVALSVVHVVFSIVHMVGRRGLLHCHFLMLTGHWLLAGMLLGCATLMSRPRTFDVQGFV